MSDPYSAIVFGKGPVAIHAARVLLERGADLRMVVPSRGVVAGQVSLTEWAHDADIPVWDEPGWPPPTDLGLSVYFDRIFRQDVIDGYGRLLNVHNSLLPRHRGVRPINWALADGDREHGVSLHEITAGIDTGPVLAQESFPIDPHRDEVADVYARCLEAATRLIDRMAPVLLTAPATPQDDSRASAHHSRDDRLLGERRYWRRGEDTLG